VQECPGKFEKNSGKEGDGFRERKNQRNQLESSGFMTQADNNQHSSRKSAKCTTIFQFGDVCRGRGYRYKRIL